jgi:hypothetical protein
MTPTLRQLLLATVLSSSLVTMACGDDAPADPKPDAGSQTDAARPASAALPRPGLPRPPTGGLPDELRPPR